MTPGFARFGSFVARALALVALCILVARPAHADAPPPAAGAAGSGAADNAAKGDAPLPAEHLPQLQMTVVPNDRVHTGDVVHVKIAASATAGDDVTVTEQSFAPFEVQKKRVHAEAASAGKQTFVFELDLLAFEPGDAPIPAVELRVVTKDGLVGSVKTAPVPYAVRSLLANEPNAQPKLETKPVIVMQDNYVPLYIVGGLLAVALIAGLTLLVSRYLQKRRKRALPPPPPRPAWDVAIEKLGELRRRKQQMVDDGQGALFVDQLSDVLREYLGGRFGFDGLETTSDEMILLLRAREANLGLTQEVGQFLGRCDLVKFAKVEPDQDEVDLLFSKAQDLVQHSLPQPVNVNASGQPGPTRNDEAAS